MDSIETDGIEADNITTDSIEKSQISEARLILDTYKAWQDIQQLLEGQMPPEGEDYGPWKLQMDLLRHDLKTEGPALVQSELLGLLEQYQKYPDALPCWPFTPEGRPWMDVLEERIVMQAREARLQALKAKAEEQEDWQWELAKARVQEQREREEQRAYGWQEEKREPRTPMREWTLTQLADEIMDFLWDQEDHSRTEIQKRFGGSISSERLTDALDYLALQGRAKRRRVPTKGRPREVWYTLEGL